MRPEPNIGTSGSQRSSNVLNPPIKINSPNRFVTMHLTHDNSGFAFRFSPRFDKIVEMLIPARQTVINFWKLRPPIEPVESPQRRRRRQRPPLRILPPALPLIGSRYSLPSLYRCAPFLCVARSHAACLPSVLLV